MGRKDYSISVCNYCARPCRECSLMMRSIPPKGAKWTIKRVDNHVTSTFRGRNGGMFVYLVSSCPYYQGGIDKEEAERMASKQMTNSREKGARGERELANILKGYGYAAQRGQQFAGSPDSPDVKGLPGIHIECKRVEHLNIYAGIRQSEKDCGDDELPAVFHRKNNQEWLVTMKLDDWMRLYREARE